MKNTLNNFNMTSTKIIPKNKNKTDNTKITKEDLYRIYIHWKAEPEADRKPSSREEFMDKYNINLAIISGWENSEHFAQDLELAARAWGRGKVPELLHLLYTQIKKSKKATDIETFKKLVTGGDPVTPGGDTYNVISIKPSDEQLRQILHREARNAGLLDSGRA